MSADARAHSESLIAAHTDRLRALEVLHARAGDGADPKISIEIAEIKVAIAELESHAPQPLIIAQARQAVRDQYANDWEFRQADDTARGLRQIQSANDVHDALLTLVIESRRIRYVTTRNTWLILMLFVLFSLIGMVLVLHLNVG